MLHSEIMDDVITELIYKKLTYARELRKHGFEQFDIQSDLIQNLAYEIRERVMVGYTEESYDSISGSDWIFGIQLSK